jgi:hypothetical protein
VLLEPPITVADVTITQISCHGAIRPGDLEGAIRRNPEG